LLASSFLARAEPSPSSTLARASITGAVDGVERRARPTSAVGVEGHVVGEQCEEGLHVAAEACLQETLYQAFLLLRGALETRSRGRYRLPGAA
jgi:hypothetical protein